MAQARFCVTAIFSEKNEKNQFDNKKNLFQFDNDKKFNLTMKKKNFFQFEIGWAISSSVLVQHGCSDASMGVESRLAAAG